MINYGLRGAIFNWIDDPKNEAEFHKSRFIKCDCIPLSDETWKYLEEEVPEHEFWEIGELDEYACLEGISIFYLRELHRHGWLNKELQEWYDRIESDERLKGKIPCENHCGPFLPGVNRLIDYSGSDSARECHICLQCEEVAAVS